MDKRTYLTWLFYLPSNHADMFCYETSDKSVAAVSKNGTIIAKGNSVCTVYAYTINRNTKKVKVTVK